MGSCSSVDAENISARRNNAGSIGLDKLSEMVNGGGKNKGRSIEEYSDSSDSRRRIKTSVKGITGVSTVKCGTYRDIVKRIQDRTEEFNNRVCNRPVILKQDGTQVKLQKKDVRESSSTSYYYSDDSYTSEHSSDYIYLKQKEQK